MALASSLRFLTFLWLWSFLSCPIDASPKVTQSTKTRPVTEHANNTSPSSDDSFTHFSREQRDESLGKGQRGFRHLSQTDVDGNQHGGGSVDIGATAQGAPVNPKKLMCRSRKQRVLSFQTPGPGLPRRIDTVLAY